MTLAGKMADARYDGYDEGLSIGLEQGLEQGAYQNKLETSKQMLLNGITIPLIVDCTNLPLETVLELAQTK